MTVQIYRQYVFTDGSKYTPTDLDSEVDQIAATINNANGGQLTWDHVNAVASTITTATITNLNISTPLSIANGGTASGTTLNNNRFMVSSGSKIVEASAVTASRAVASDTNGLPTASTTTSTELGYVHALAGLSSALGSITTADSMNTAFGKIISARLVQIGQATTQTNTSTTSSTFQSTSLAASITPQSTSNFILIFATGATQVTTAGKTVYLSIFRGSTNLGNATSGLGGGTFAPSATSAATTNPFSLIYLDSPATTSSTTYTVKIASADNATSVLYGPGNVEGVIIVAEISQGN